MASHKSPSVPADQDNGFVRKVTVNLVVTFIKKHAISAGTDAQTKKINNHYIASLVWTVI